MIQGDVERKVGEHHVDVSNLVRGLRLQDLTPQTASQLEKELRGHFVTGISRIDNDCTVIPFYLGANGIWTPGGKANLGDVKVTENTFKLIFDSAYMGIQKLVELPFAAHPRYAFYELPGVPRYAGFYAVRDESTSIIQWGGHNGARNGTSRHIPTEQYFWIKKDVLKALEDKLQRADR